MFQAGPFGKLAVNGFFSGLGLVQSNHVPGDESQQAGLNNGMISIQKTDGWFQFYVQGGAYNTPSLGASYITTADSVSKLWGPLPVAFVKLQAGKNTSIMVGSLPTLIGAEYTFSFENMNVNRGLLWNQENAINRGIQLNQTMGKFSASFSWNDGFYSSRYNWLSGSLAYTNGAHTLAFVGAGNAGKTVYQTFATPLQNNSTIYNIIYTYNKNGWILQPYYQYTKVPASKLTGVGKDTSTNGFAILANKSFSHGFSLPVRYEYISSSGSAKDGSVNLMYGPGSNATSFTVTPTFQSGGFFARGDIAWVHAGSVAPGAAFGLNGNENSQFRAVGEIGFIFGSNIKP